MSRSNPNQHGCVRLGHTVLVTVYTSYYYYRMIPLEILGESFSPVVHYRLKTTTMVKGLSVFTTGRNNALITDNTILNPRSGLLPCQVDTIIGGVTATSIKKCKQLLTS
jgi:hypothetical protein